MRPLVRSIAAVSLVALLAGCASVGRLGQLTASPQVPAPARTAPADWPMLAPLPPAERSVGADATLDQIVALLPAAPDLSAARARAAGAAAQAQAVRAGLLPNITASADASRASVQPGFGPPSAGRVNANSLALRLDAPLDLAGSGRARASSAGEQAVAAAAEAERVALITRRSVGSLLESWRAARVQTGQLTDAAQVARRTADLVQDRFRAGLSSELELTQARQAERVIAARIPAARQAGFAAERALDALLGVAPGTLTPILDADRVPQSTPVPGLDLPAAVLDRRPDVRAAAARLKAAGLDARAAQRDRWPSVSLSALIGRTDPGFVAAASTDSLALSVLAPVFDFGRLDQLAKAAGARADEAAALYRAALAGAVQDVATEAGRLSSAAQTKAELTAAASAAGRRVTLTEDRQRAGLASLIDVLDARQAHLDTLIALALARQDEAIASHALRAALAL